MKDRRHALLRILNSFRVDRTEYLHGRQTVFDAEGYIKQIEDLFAPSLFQQVMEASPAYIKRFKGEMDEDGATTQFALESDEFYQAATEYEPYCNDYEAQQHKQRMLGEAFDVMVTLGGVLACFDVTQDEIEQAMRAGLKKLTDRTDDDYAWYPSVKRVVKKSKMESAS